VIIGAGGMSTGIGDRSNAPTPIEQNALVGDVYAEVRHLAIAHFFIQGNSGARGLQNSRLDARAFGGFTDYLPHNRLRETQPAILG
jgi:hypothetical protein